MKMMPKNIMVIHMLQKRNAKFVAIISFVLIPEKTASVGAIM